MNVADSRKVGEYFAARGWVEAEDPAEADVVFINTCSVRHHAEHKASSYLGRLALLRKKAPDMKIVFAGCMAERVKNTIQKRFPMIDLVIGAREIEDVPRILDEYLGAPCDEPVRTERNQHQATAYVNIVRGCENFCSYCIVPFVRGPEVSRPAGDILADIRRYADSGAKEIMLLGQNVNSYRAPDGKDFPALLRLVDAVDGIQRIRFMTSHPKDLSDAMIAAMGACLKVCHHVHLPLQSGSDAILAAMNRQYTSAAYLALVSKLRAALPGLTLTTDVMVGFPGETDTDFAATLSIMEHADFDFLYAFKYSPRPGTGAAAREDTVPTDIKESRLAALLERADIIAARKNAALIGTNLEVMVDERIPDGKAVGRTRGNKKVYFTSPDAAPGDIITVAITGCKTNTMEGTPCPCALEHAG